MGIAEYLLTENVVLGLKSTSRNEVFKALALSLASSGKLDKKGVEVLVRKLKERESLCTTGVGEGIALPHASLDSIKETIIALGVVPGGVEFNAIDGKPADVIFMIIGSQSIPRQHIQILAKIVRLCRNKELIKKIRNESDPSEVRDAIRSMGS